MWIIYVVAAFLGGTGRGVWAIVWCVFNIACLAAVLYGLAKNNMQFLFPALGYSIAIILVGLINVVVNFIQLAWIAAIWLLAIFALTVYYALGLVTLLDDIEEVTTAPATQEGPAPSGRRLQNAECSSSCLR